MKKLSTILLFFIIFFQSFTPLLIQINYVLNKAYIASVLCENKEKPALKCQGKCYLAKQLKEQQQKEELPGLKKEKPELPAFYLPAAIITEYVVLLSSTPYPELIAQKPTAIDAPVFHPPA